MLRTAMGPAIAAALADPLVIEVMVNPDGALRLDRLGSGRCDTGVRLEAAQVERIVRLVASHARSEIHAAAPIVSAELPPHGEGLAGERFEGVLPPVADEDDAARAVGRDRFAAFVERVGRRLAGGRLALLPEEDGR